MKRLLFFCFLVFFCFPAVGQYNITEVQLQKLESILASYKASNQQVQSKLEALQREAESLQKDLIAWKNKATELQKASATLQQQLQQERELTKSLNSSLTRYEEQVTQITALQIEAVLEAEKANARASRWCVAFWVLLGILVVIVGGWLLSRLIRKKI